VTDFESQIYRRDRSIIWISENARAVRDDRGKLLYYEGMVEDITARKRAEDEVRFSERRFRSVWENALDGMRLTDAHGTILAVNPSFCRIVGLPRQELIGKPFTVIYSDDENPEEMLLKYRERFTHRTIESQLERHVVFRSGRTVDLEVYNSYIEMEVDTLVLGVFHDITIRKQAEERERQATRELAASQAELRVKNEMLEDDLKMAHEIQLAILPQQYPTFPKGVSIEQSLLRFSHRYQPSGEVGGDFFNVLPISSTKAGVFICDVMGHGVRSALVTAMVRALVEELRTIGHDPGLLLMRLNSDLRAILQQTGTPLFTTAFYLVADLETRQISYANAGHPKPYLIHPGSGEVEMLKNPSQKASPALGLFADSVYPTAQRELTPGDLFLFYTDGLYEVEGPDETLYTQEQLTEAVRKNSQKPSSSFLDELLSEIKGFSASQKFADDVCLVAMEVAKETR
jgi:sigma-B regulation protein RsbU (phosphoserine phosphatase)